VRKADTQPQRNEQAVPRGLSRASDLALQLRTHKLPAMEPLRRSLRYSVRVSRTWLTVKQESCAGHWRRCGQACSQQRGRDAVRTSCAYADASRRRHVVCHMRDNCKLCTT
jgi:hypothetical protein